MSYFEFGSPLFNAMTTKHKNKNNSLIILKMSLQNFIMKKGQLCPQAVQMQLTISVICYNTRKLALNFKKFNKIIWIMISIRIFFLVFSQ